MFSLSYLKRLNSQRAVSKNPLRVEAEKDETATLIFSVDNPAEPVAIAHEQNGVPVTKQHPDLYFWCPKCGKVYERLSESGSEAQVGGFCRNDAPKESLAQRANEAIRNAINRQRGV